jgi:hypothetical protein
LREAKFGNVLKMTKSNRKKSSNNGANLGFEAKLWQAADAMRGSMCPNRQFMIVRI